MTLFVLGQNDPHAKNHVELWLGLVSQKDEVADASSNKAGQQQQQQEEQQQQQQEEQQEQQQSGEEVVIKLTGAVFNKHSRVKLWWWEGRPIGDIIEIGHWPKDPRPIICSAEITRRGEPYCRIPFVLSLAPVEIDVEQQQQQQQRGDSDVWNQNQGALKVTTVPEIGLPFWSRSLHRDCDVPCTQAFPEDEPLKKWETTPCGRYALLIASDGDDVSGGSDARAGRVTDAIQLEKVLRAHGYSIVRLYGNAVGSMEDVRRALRDLLRPPEPPRQVGRGGWWAGGSRSAEVFAFVSVPWSMEYHQLRNDMMVGGRCGRPYYLQGYVEINF